MNIICENCKNPFVLSSKKKHDIKRYNLKKLFCSETCHNKYVTKDNVTTLCHQCSKIIIRTKGNRKTNKSGFFFCSSSCAASFNNTLKRKSRRSKIEKELFNLLEQTFPNLKFIPNDKTMLGGLEVDIAVPSLKLAIEWNGIVHFKPIYGQIKLDKVQSIDQKKLLLAQQKDINLIVISDFKSDKQTFNKAFSQVSEIIKELCKSE